MNSLRCGFDKQIYLNVIHNHPIPQKHVSGQDKNRKKTLHQKKKNQHLSLFAPIASSSILLRHSFQSPAIGVQKKLKDPEAWSQEYLRLDPKE